MRFTESQTWLVCFKSSTVSPWYAKLLHPMFRHVVLIREIGENEYIIFEVLNHCLSVRIFNGAIEQLIGESSVVISKTVHYSMVYEQMPLRILSCVSVSLMLLGIKKRILTPRGLYKELKKTGMVIKDI